MKNNILFLILFSFVFSGGKVQVEVYPSEIEDDNSVNVSDDVIILYYLFIIVL